MNGDRVQGKEQSIVVAKDERTMMACISIGDTPLVHPAGHPRAGEVVEFPIRVPGAYEMMISVKDFPSCWARFHVDVDKDGRVRIRLVEESSPDGFGLTPLERELLDGLARIIARNVLRQRAVV